MTSLKHRGRFITFEGGEGSGKSTQIRILADRLRKLGLDVVLTREPGGSPKAEKIRAALLAGQAKPLGPLGEALLFAAARIDHLRSTINPALERGAWVLCDRFADSTRVYQGIVGSLAPELIGTLERVTLAGVVPDLTLVFDVPAGIGLARAARRGAQDRFEKETLDFHEGIREGFLAVAKVEPKRCAVVDGRGTSEEVAALVWREILSRLDPVGPAVLLNRERE